MNRYVASIIGWIFAMVILLPACEGNSSSSGRISSITDDSITGGEDSSNTEPDPVRRIRISAVGDIMLHDYQMERAYRNDTDTFDFSPVFQHVLPYFDEADLLIGNLETVFAGKNKGRSKKCYGYSSFPYFNSPDCFAATLADAGFGWLATANNHTLDSYPEGVVKTLNLLDSLHIRHHGTARDSSEHEELCIIERNGIKVGLCSYTYSLNGIRLSPDQAYLVNEFRNYDTAKVKKMYQTIRRLKQANVDFTIAYIHCGTEYQRSPNLYQRQLADSLHKIGCDLILMSHPHILQRMAILTSKDSLQKSLVAYSLGNFLSSQVRSRNIPKDIGAILEVDVEKNGSGTHICKVSVVPTYSYWRKNHIGVLPVIKAHDQPQNVISLYAKDKKRIDEAYNETLRTLCGKMDSTRWSIEGERYILKW